MKKTDLAWPLAVLGVILIVGLTQPVFLLVAWRLNLGAPQITVATDLAAIMAAIFTAGGLIVAAIAIYTMVNVQSVARQSVEPLVEAIPRQIESRVRLFLEAYGFYTRAQNIRGWGNGPLDAAESLIEQARSLEPAISGMLQYLGTKYYIAAALSYKQTRMPDRMMFEEGTFIERSTFASVAAKSSQWLREAISKDDGDSAEAAAQLAELSGMMGSPVDDTIKLVQKANSKEYELLPSGWQSLLFLFGACRSEHDIQRLSSVLNIAAPLTARDAIRRFYEHLAAEGRENPLYYIVLPIARAGDPYAPMSPGFVTVRHLDSGKKACADWLPARQPGMTFERRGIPHIGDPDSTGVQNRTDMIEPQQLFDRLCAMFYLVTATETLDGSLPERLQQ